MRNKYANYVTSQLNEPGQLENFTRREFGLDPKSFETQLAALAEIRAGRMPDSATFKQIAQEAKQHYGWSEKRTQQALQKIVDLPAPQYRVAAFLRAGGHPVTESVVKMVDGYAENYGLIRSEVDLETKINEREQREANDPLAKKHVPEYKNGASEQRDAQRLRNTLEFLSGANKPQTFAEKQAAVVRARLQVADRVEMHSAKENPSLRESLANEYELHHVNELSKEYGLGDPLQEAKDKVDENLGHLSESFDPIESTGVTDDK